MKKAKTRIKINKKIFMLLILFILSISMVFFSQAKYVFEDEQTDSYVAKNFYFKSNLLTTNTTTSYTYGNGENKIEFTISNSEDELRFSEVDINYTATLKDLSGNVIETQEGTLSKDTLDIKTISFTDLETGTYKVTLESTSPYSKILYGTFYITAKDENINYEVSDSENSSILYLTINAKDYAGDVLIAYPSGLKFDNTDSKIKSYTDTTLTISFENYSEYSLIFFKEDITQIYKTADFTVEKNN